MAKTTKWEKGKSGNPAGAGAIQPVSKEDLALIGNKFVKRLIELLSQGDDWDEIIKAAIDGAKKGNRWDREWLSKWGIEIPTAINASGGNQLVQFNIVWSGEDGNMPDIQKKIVDVDLD